MTSACRPRSCLPLRPVRSPGPRPRPSSLPPTSGARPQSRAVGRVCGAVESWVEGWGTSPKPHHLPPRGAGRPAPNRRRFEVRGAGRQPAGPRGGRGRRAPVPGRRCAISCSSTLHPGKAGGAPQMMAYGLLQEVAGTDLLRPLPEAGTIELRASLWSPGKVEPVGVYSGTPCSPTCGRSCAALPGTGSGWHPRRWSRRSWSRSSTSPRPASS